MLRGFLYKLQARAHGEGILPGLGNPIEGAKKECEHKKTEYWISLYHVGTVDHQTLIVKQRRILI